MDVETYKYKQNGCVGASTRRLLDIQGYDFATYAEGFKQYQLEQGNEENIHMLGVPIVLAEANLSTYLHTISTLEEYQLPPNASPKAFDLQPLIIAKINNLHGKNSFRHETGFIDLDQFRNVLLELIGKQYLGLVFVDWDKWATTPERIVGYNTYKNPRHVVCIQGINGESVDIYDPAIVNTSQSTTMLELYNSLNDKQQLVFIEKNRQEV